MSNEATVYIGLGSNLGDRADFIDKASKAVDGCEQIELVRLSSVVETEALGKGGGGKYLNAVAEVRTDLTAEELYGRLVEIETSLGRVRGEKWGPRTIDLDLLLYGDEIIDSADLIVPHKQMHLRSFVLDGMCELGGELVHPVLERSMAELAERLNGRSFVIDSKAVQLVSIAGLIGVGKTTLAKGLAEEVGGELLLEAYDTNPFLAKVYGGKKELAFASQLYFLTSRVGQMNKESLKAGRAVVSDYVYDKELIYAKHGLDDEQFGLYERINHSFANNIVGPVVVIYLKDEAENCLERICKRNRPYEQGIKLESLRKLRQEYEKLFERWDKCPVIRISMAEFDCRDAGQVRKLAEEVKNYLVV